MLTIISVLISVVVLYVPLDDVTHLNLSEQLYFHTYSGSKDGNDVLYYVQDTITTPKQAFMAQGTIRDFTWTPDGTKIAIFVNDHKDETSLAEIYSGDFEFITHIRLNLFKNDTYHYPVVWTSDSEYLLAVISNQTDMPYVSIISLDPSIDAVEHAIPISESEQLHRVYWSPNAKYALYQTEALSGLRERGEDTIQPQTYRLYLLNLETFQPTLVTQTSYFNCVVWSNDGNRFATATDFHRDVEFPFLLRMNSLTIYNTELEIIEELDTSTDFDEAIGCPISWSNSGQWISLGYAIINTSEKINSGVVSIDIQTREVKDVWISDSVSYAILSMQWSPDDSWIAIETLYNAYGDIRLFSRDTGEEFVISVTEGVPLFNPHWRHIDE